MLRRRTHERRIHAKGSRAYGTFTVTHDITQYTRAKIFSQIGKQTPLLSHVTTVAGERGCQGARSCDLITEPKRSASTQRGLRFQI